jgi:hypothetical protein
VQRFTPGLVLAFCLSFPGFASAQSDGLDWASLAEVDTVQVLTVNEDTRLLDTTVWLVVVDDRGYIRTGGTAWGDNVVRDPEIEISIEGTTYPVTVRFVEDEGLRQRITDTFREKYGFIDSVIGLFRGDRPKLMGLTAR